MAGTFAARNFLSTTTPARPMPRFYPKRKQQLCRGPEYAPLQPPPLLLPHNRIILSLYDYSGNWSAPYRAAGYEVIQVDKELNGTDVRLYNPPFRSVHGILAAPPCTVFSKAAGALVRTEAEMLEAVACVDAVLRLVFKLRPCWWALENPQGRLRNWLGPPQLKFHPFHYGDEHTKLTYLWGRFAAPILAQVAPTIKDITTWGGHSMRTRSNTPPGFSAAFHAANP